MLETEQNARKNIVERKGELIAYLYGYSFLFSLQITQILMKI